jgi:KDO2-lipid IV(A) lauroyltransferase
MRHKLEYAPVWLLVRTLGVLPRPIARSIGITLGLVVYVLHSRLRRVGMRNLALAFPERTVRERRRILRGVYRSVGRLAAEFCLFPRYTHENVSKVAIYDGFENFDLAEKRGRGVLFLTAHFGGWEVGASAHAIYGHKLRLVVRPLDNPYINRLVDRYRCWHGNMTFGKQEFARGLLSAMKGGETVTILMDTNTTPPQGVFVPFFGRLACTASGVARVALRTDAAVVPGFVIWDKELRKYRIHFDPPVTLIRTGDQEADVTANTAFFTRIIEDHVRRYPDQWMWVHRRWKTRPPGEPPIY